ncbi:ComEC/Rec2 family competence protein [bacterium]|nr:ComEC/Rec2 family competence protein [bacterium]
MLNRPIAIVLFLWIAGIVLAFNFIPPPLYFLFLACFFFLFPVFFHHPLAKSFLLFAFFPLSVAINSVYFVHNRTPPSCIGKGFLEGKVVEEISFTKNKKPFLLVKAERIRAGNNEDKGKIVQVFFDDWEGRRIKMGEKVELKGNIVVPSTKIRLQGTSYYMKSAEFLNVSEGEGFLSLIGKLRGKILEASKNALPPTSALILTNLVVGKADSPSPTKLLESFKKTGTIHILVVSGTQVSLLLAFVWFLLRLFHVRASSLGVLFLRKQIRRKIGLEVKDELVLLSRGLSFLFLFSFLIIGYSFLVGGELPIQRASLMGILGLIATALGRKMDTFNIFAITALVILLSHPPALYTPSFQLSFLAVWGLISLLPIVQALIPTPHSPIARFLYLIFATSLSAQLAVSPLLIHYFKMFSPISLIANIFAVPLSLLILVEGLIFIPFLIIIPASKLIIAPLLNIPIILLIRIVDFFSHLPLASLNLSLPPTLLYYSLFLLFLAGEVVAEPSSKFLRKCFLYSVSLFSLLLIWHNFL